MHLQNKSKYMPFKESQKMKSNCCAVPPTSHLKLPNYQTVYSENFQFDQSSQLSVNCPFAYTGPSKCLKSI